MKIQILILLLVISVVPAFAQEFEYGKPAELKGLKVIFINSGSDTESAEIFVKELAKTKLPALKVVKEAEKAQIFLLYSENKLIKLDDETAAPPPVYSKGAATIRGRKKGNIRIVLSIDTNGEQTAADPPAVAFIRAFINAYKSANRIKSVSYTHLTLPTT